MFNIEKLEKIKDKFIDRNGSRSRIDRDCFISESDFYFMVGQIEGAFGEMEAVSESVKDLSLQTKRFDDKVQSMRNKNAVGGAGHE